MPKRDVEEFISHWKGATAPEQSISQQFLLQLCDLLDVPHPGNQRNGSYTFEFHVNEVQADGSTKLGRIDLYKRASFILESKKFQEKIVEQTDLELAAEKMGAVARRKKIAAPVRDTDRWDDAMLKAFIQARDYVRALPPDEPAPPFLLVVDVGHVIEVRADFSLTGRAYQPFPDPLTFRIRLDQLRDEKTRERLKLIWTDPQALDPSKRSAEVTREVAKHLAELAKSFEKAGHTPKIVAEFLTRCLFCMFAEDVGLLPNSDGKPGFTELLNSLPANGEGFETMLRTLFAEMNEGCGKGHEVSVILRRKLLKFNGGLFADNTVLPVNGTQLGILKAAAALDWQHVEPAIFGTLLERALGGEGERHKLGAHFTPRSYVERLVLPTVIEPLRAEWENVRAAAYTFENRSSARSAKAKELMAATQKKQDKGDYAAAINDYKLVQDEEKIAAADLEKARSEINSFHERLCNLKVLDPACGSGNFLYVALEHLKRLEGEVLIAAADFGANFKLGLEKHTVDPHQFLGLEINPRAASIAEMVLWIGYLQWHFRTRGQTMPAEPVLKNFKNIQCRDAVLASDGEPQPALDAAGNAKSVWNRLGKKTDAVTGREVPDETKRVPLLTYANPRPATWPEADFIVGNPPFMGARTIRPALDDGYLDALRGVYPNIPENADFVMYWWHKAAELVRAGKVKRFGLITTNSLRQSFNRQVTETQLAAQPPLSLAFAICEAAALHLIAAWCEEHRGGTLPEKVIPLARAAARKLKPNSLEETDLHIVGFLRALVERTKDEGLRTLLRQRYSGIPDAKWSWLEEKAKELSDNVLAEYRKPVLDFVAEKPKNTLAAGHTMRRAVARLGRNDPCHCGSGKKYKHCCIEKDQERLHHSSDVAGLTQEELYTQIEEYLTADRLEKMEPYETARLNPAKIPAALLDAYFLRLGAFNLLDRAADALEMLGWSDRLKAGWESIMFASVRNGRRDVAQRLMRLREPHGFKESELDFSERFLLAGDDAAHCLQLIEENARKILQSENMEDLLGLAYGVTFSKFSALGIMLYRGVFPLVPPDRAAASFEQLLVARDRLNLPPDDLFSDIMDKRLAEQGEAGENKDSAKLRQAQRSLAVKAQEVRELKDTMERLQKEIVRREKKSSAPAPAVPVTKTAPVDEPALKEMRRKMDELKSALKERHHERNELRRELQKTQASLEEIQNKSVSVTHDENGGHDTEDSLLLPADALESQPIRLIEFPKHFSQTLAPFPRHVARAAMIMIGRLAAGDPAAYVGALRLKATPNVMRQRIGSDYRLLFRLWPERMEVIDLINRKDLDRRIKTLV